MKKLLSIILLLCLCFELNAQELLYNILISGKQVGTMLVTKERKGENEVYYSAVSDVKYSLFRTTELIYFYEASYINDSLDRAYFIYKKNGDMEEEAKLLWSDKGYQSTKPDKHLQYKEKLSQSMLCMYFQQPKHRDEIFSERFHDYIRVGATDDDSKFIFYIPNDDKNIYYYNEKGICEKISISAGVLSFEMVLSE